MRYQPDMPNESHPELLQRLMRERGVKQSDLVKALGESKQNIFKVHKGLTQMSKEWAQRIAPYLNVTWPELMGYDPDVTTQDSTTLTQVSEFKSEMRLAPLLEAEISSNLIARDLKVWGSAEGGPNGYFMVEGLSPTEFTDLIPRPLGLRGLTKAFALYVVGDSMAPWREPGELIYVNAARQPSPGCYVVVVLRSPDGTDEGLQRALVKKLIKRSASFVELEQYNPAKTFRLDMAEVEIVYRIMTNDEVNGMV